MERLNTERRYLCRTLALVTLVMFASGCGLSNREKLVADTNTQIDAVQSQSESIATAIYDLPDQPTGPEHFSDLLSSYQTYRVEVDRLNVLLHNLGAVVPELTEHLRDSFDPEVEDTLADCDAAIAIFERTEATEDDYQEALTAVCLCIERYATAVTGVSQEYDRLAG